MPWRLYFAHTMRCIRNPQDHLQRQEHQRAIWFHQYITRLAEQPEANPYGRLLRYISTHVKDIPTSQNTKPTDRKLLKILVAALPDIKKIIRGFNIPVT